MTHSPHYLFVLWFAAATVGAVAGIAGFLTITLGVMT